MREIKKFNMVEQYGEEQTFYNSGLYELVEALQETKNPWRMRKCLIGITQLYFDGLVESPLFEQTPEACKRNRFALEALLNVGIVYVGRFYTGAANQEALNSTKKNILPHIETIIRYGNDGPMKSYHLAKEHDALLQYGVTMCSRPFDVDTIVPIASEGFEPAFLASYIFGGKILPVRFSHVNRNDAAVREPSCIATNEIQLQIHDKAVMVVEGTVSSGRSLVN